MDYEDILDYYEYMDDAILSEPFYEDGESITHKVARKIQELIQKLKEFFQNMKRKCIESKVKKLVDVGKANPTEIIYAQVNDQRVVNAMKKMIDAHQKALKEIERYHSEYLADKYSYEKFKDKCNITYTKLEKYCDFMKKKSDFLIKHTKNKQDAIRMADASKKIEKVLDEYNRSMDKLYKDCENTDRAITGKLSYDETKARTAVSAANNNHAAARNVAITILTLLVIQGAKHYEAQKSARIYVAKQDFKSANHIAEQKIDEYTFKTKKLYDSGKISKEEADNRMQKAKDAYSDFLSKSMDTYNQQKHDAAHPISSAFSKKYGKRKKS